MRHIRSRGNRWYIRFYDAGRSPKEKTVSLPKDSFTRRQIKRKRDELYARWHNDRPDDDPWHNPDFGKGTAGSGSGQSLTSVEAAQKYIDAKTEAGERGERGGWTEASAGPRERVLLRFAREFAPKRARDVKTDHVSKMVYGLDIAQATRRGYHRKIKAMLRWWEEEDLIERVPDLPPVPQSSGRLPAFVSVTDLYKICSLHEAEGGERWMIGAWWFGLFQGLRLSLLTQLRGRNINFSADLISVGDYETDPKGKKHAVIPLVPEARPIAQKWIGNPNARLFREGGASAEQLSRIFTERAREAVPEKPRLSMHKLRSGCAVYWLRRGARLPYVQRLLRHSRIQTTMRYLPLVNADLHDELRRVSIMR